MAVYDVVKFVLRQVYLQMVKLQDICIAFEEQTLHWLSNSSCYYWIVLHSQYRYLIIMALQYNRIVKN